MPCNLHSCWRCINRTCSHSERIARKRSSGLSRSHRPRYSTRSTIPPQQQKKDENDHPNDTPERLKGKEQNTQIGRASCRERVEREMGAGCRKTTETEVE